MICMTQPTFPFAPNKRSTELRHLEKQRGECTVLEERKVDGAPFSSSQSTTIAQMFQRRKTKSDHFIAEYLLVKVRKDNGLSEAVEK